MKKKNSNPVTCDDSEIWCEECGQEITKCSSCGNELHPKDEIQCDNSDKHHSHVNCRNPRGETDERP